MLSNSLMYASSSELSLMFGHDGILMVSPKCEEMKRRGIAESGLAGE